ncbi:MAG: hypothetical protein IPK97_06480 [Ahniella sp.]|nr:hypothetical protein [Ahniella sp.]
MTPEQRKEVWLKAQTALQQSQWSTAEPLLRELVADDASDYAAQVNLGACLIQLNRLAEAELQTLVAISAGHMTSLLMQRHAQLMHAVDRPTEERLTQAEQWLRHFPDEPQAQIAAAFAERALGRFGAARQRLLKVLERDPRHLLAAWAQFQYPQDLVAADVQAMDTYRRQFDEGLEAFAQLQFSNDDTLPRRALDALGSTVPFHLAYLPESDAARAQRYGKQLRRLALAAGLRDRAGFTRVKRAAPRVVVFSAHLHQHSVSRVWRDLLIDASKGCELIALHAGNIEDESIRRWREAGVEVVQGLQNIVQWSRVLHRLDPDILIYTDLGMEPLSTALASIRHARRQYATWAHPMGSGLETIDGFLSSDLAEPADAQSHYREKLIRLPGLASSYRFPIANPEPAAIPADTATRHIACLQIGYKLTPDQDSTWSALLDLDPNLHLHLTPNLLPEGVEQIRRRIGASVGPDRAARIEWHDVMPFNEYVAHIRRMLVIVDTEHFSGGLTHADALSLGVPVVTIEGNSLRSRQTAAMLRLLDLPELICGDRAALVTTVQRLLVDTAWHESIRARLHANRSRLIGHADAARALNILLLGGKA